MWKHHIKGPWRTAPPPGSAWQFHFIIGSRGVSRTGLRGGGGVQKLQSDGGNKGIENRQMYKMSKSRIEDATKYQSVD